MSSKLVDLYFYKGRYRTDEGLKRILIKEGIVWISKKRNYYLWDKHFEYYYDYEMLKDYCTDWNLITPEEAKHFTKWLRQKIKDGEIEVVNHAWYHCEENEGVGTTDWWDTREAVKDGTWGTKFLDELIESTEESCDAYVDIISEEEFKAYEKLPDDEQYKIAMKWRIKTYNEYMEANN